MSDQRSSSASKFTESVEINDLVSRLLELLPQLNQRSNSRITVLKILKEACSHILRLQKEVEDLSERLTGMVDSVDIGDIDIRVLECLLQQ